jgi:hypothetical protein
MVRQKNFRTRQLRILFALFITLTGCSLLSRGYYNEDFIFVPKKPNFKLAKTKFEYNKTSMLDTVGYYQLSEIYYNGEKTFDFNWPYHSWSQSNVVIFKFNSDGTCYYVGVPYSEYSSFKHNSLVQKKYLKPSNFEYYRFITSHSIKIEVFVNSPGLGSYQVEKYSIINNGTTIYEDVVGGEKRVYLLKKFE